MKHISPAYLLYNRYLIFVYFIKKRNLWPLILILFISSCSTGQYIVPDYGLKGELGQHRGAKVIVLTPLISFKQADSNNNSNLNDYNLNNKSDIQFIVEKKLIENGLTVININESGEYQKDKTHSLFDQLNKNRFILASRFKEKSGLIQTLNEAQNVFDAGLVCVVLLDVTLGDYGIIDPVLTGNARQSSHSSDLKIVMLSLHNGEHVWRNEIYARDLPKDTNITQWVERLFEH